MKTRAGRESSFSGRGIRERRCYRGEYVHLYKRLRI